MVVGCDSSSNNSCGSRSSCCCCCSCSATPAFPVKHSLEPRAQPDWKMSQARPPVRPDPLPAYHEIEPNWNSIFEYCMLPWIVFICICSLLCQKLERIQINQHITNHLPKAYSFGNLTLDYHGRTDREPSIHLPF